MAASILIFWIVVLVVFSIPSVQTKVAQRTTKWLNEEFDIAISINRIGLNWKAQADIRQLLIKDHKQDTLIYVARLHTHVLGMQNLLRDNFRFSKIAFEQPFFKLQTYAGDTKDNLTIFTEKLESDTPDTTAVFKLFARNLVLNDGRFLITDLNKASGDSVYFSNLYLNAAAFEIIDDKILAQIQHLQMYSNQDFTIADLQADFEYNSKFLALKTMQLATKHSTFKGIVQLNYPNGMSDFNNAVIFDAFLTDARINTTDLKPFYQPFASNEILTFKGDFNGSLNNFRCNPQRLQFGNTRIQGLFTAQHLVDGSQPFVMQLNNHNILTQRRDLVRLLPNLLSSNLPKELTSLGLFSFKGNSRLTPAKFQTESTLQTALGNASTSLVVNNLNTSQETGYEGTITLEEFNLGTFANTALLGPVSGTMAVNGSGFSPETLQTEMQGTFTKFTCKGYPYQNISVDGNFKTPVFKGSLQCTDPNLNLDFNGLIAVSETSNEYRFQSDITHANLAALNLFTRDSVSNLSGRVEMNMVGTSLDNVVGNVHFINTTYTNERETFYFNDIALNANNLQNGREITIDAPDVVEARLFGTYTLADLPNLFQNSVGSIYANYKPRKVTPNQRLEYRLKIYNRIVGLFIPELELDENTRITGSVSSDESLFKLNFKSPKINFQDNTMYNVSVQVDNDNPLYNTYLALDSVHLKNYALHNVNVINKTLNDTLYVRSEFLGGLEKQDNYNLSWYHTINPEGKSVVGLKRSNIHFQEKNWTLNPRSNSENKVVFDNNFKDVAFQNFLISHENETIRLDGHTQGRTEKDIRLQLSNVALGSILPPLQGLQFSGTSNGTVAWVQREGAYFPSATVSVKNLGINAIPYGDFEGLITGNQNLTQYLVQIGLMHNNSQTLGINGFINAATAVPEMNLSTRIENLNISPFGNLDDEVFTNVRGFLSGNAVITGAYNTPNVTGNVTLDRGGLTIPYLNIDMSLQDRTTLYLYNNQFNIIPTTLTDTRYGTLATLSGHISHRYFSNWNLDLNIDTSRFLVLDTPPTEEALYYGRGFISGDANISGPVDALNISVNATTEAGTSFKIPISDAESIGDDSFITFLSPQEKQARITGVEFVPKEIKGLSMNFELDINDNAEVEVLIDQVNNSTLKGRGAGILLLEINTLGKFKMWGDFLVIDGKYDFKYSGIIDKTFEVIPGGNITWDGNPYQAQLALSAKYTTQANPSVLLDNPALNRKIPVDVQIDLNGQILQPDLDFQIQFPTASSTVRSELEYKLQDKEQRQTQALFLISSGSFQSDAAVIQNAIAGTLAERVNSIVADLLSDADSKFKVLPYYVPGTRTIDQETADQFGVQLSTQISERIIIDGKVGIPVGGINESRVAGDFEVQWLVNEDGSMRINFFNRQAAIQFIGEDQIFEQGMGLSYRVDFDTFKELIAKLFNKKVSETTVPAILNDTTLGPVQFNK